MRNWSISRYLKVGMGSLSAVILLFAIGAVSATFILRAELEGYRYTAILAETTSDIAEDVMEAQIAAQSYRLTSDSAWAEEFRGNVEEATDVASEVISQDTSPETVRALVSESIDLVRDYTMEFEGIVEAERERDQVYQGLVELGLSARQAVTDLMNASNRAGDAAQTFAVATILQKTILSRLYMERFVLRGAPEAHETAMGHIDEATRQLNRIIASERNPDRINMIETAQSRLERFKEEANAMFDLTVARDARYLDVAQTSAQMVDLTDRMLEEIAATRQRQGEVIETTFRITTVALALGAALAMGFSLVLARTTIRGVGQDVERTLDTVTELADGNLDIEIEGTELDTELGRIAQALEVFRARGKEAEDLRRESEAAESRRQAEERHREEQERTAEQERVHAEQAAAEARKREIFATLQNAVSSVVGAAAAGDFSRRVDTAALDPELSALAEQINQLMARVDEGLAEIARVSGRLAEGDLRSGMQGEFEGTFQALQDNIGSMIASLGGIMSGISAEAASVRSHSAEMSTGAEDLARRAESQAASLEQTSAAMTQIASSAESNASSAAQTDAAARDMRDEAGQARSVLDSTVTAMRDIEEGSREIEAIVDVIEDIAFQTNLLSLNASVEAARAGEAGKGFAVVANEVRALAQRSAEASSKVQAIISQNTGAISRGSGAVDETGEALQRIVARIETVTDNLREIRSASDEQAAAVKDVSNAFAQLDKITQRNAAVAEQTRGTAALLSQQSERMQTAVGRVQVSAREHADDRPIAGSLSAA